MFLPKMNKPTELYQSYLIPNTKYKTVQTTQELQKASNQHIEVGKQNLRKLYGGDKSFSYSCFV